MVKRIKTREKGLRKCGRKKCRAQMAIIEAQNTGLTNWATRYNELRTQIEELKKQNVKDLHFQETKMEMIRAMSVALESCARAVLDQPYNRVR